MYMLFHTKSIFRAGIATILFCLMMFGNALYAQAEFNAKFFVTQDNVSRPTIQPNESSGALVYSIPIVIPPGRNGLQPDVSLQYNSQRNNNSNIAGYGWDIPIPYIERLNKTGTENLYTDNNYASSFDGELTVIATTTYISDYSPRFAAENSKNYEYFESTNVWKATDRDGTVYTFGTTTASRMDNPSDSTQIFRWMLNEVRDRNDNYITYAYTKDSGQMYPATITYTGYGATEGDFEISFGTESRVDSFASYRSAYAVESLYRVNQILVKIDGAWVRKYDLAYTTGANGVRSLLSSVTETGKDKDGNTAVLPAITFTYQSGSPGWSIDATWDSPVNFIKSNSGEDNSVRFSEINGDGLLDMVQAYGSAGQGSCNTKDIWINDGSGWNDGGGATIPECFRISDAGYDDTGARLGDFNGDGYTDVVRAFQENGSTTEKFYVNKRDKTDYTFEEHAEWDVPVYFYDWSSGYIPTFLVDANADGQDDLISSGSVYLFNATTTGWDMSSAVYGDAGATPDDPAGETYADVNGDGLADHIVSAFQEGVENIKHINLNNGTGFTNIASSTPPLYFYNELNNDQGVRIADVNNDGLPDMIQGTRDSGDASIYNVYVNTSTSTISWIYDAALSSALPDIYFTQFNVTGYNDGGWRIADVNGDGLTDFIGTYYYADPTTSVDIETYINTGNHADILSQVTTAQGGTVGFTYKSSLEYKDAGGAVLNTETPSPIMVLNTITRNDGFSMPMTETKEYEGAFYYFNEADDRFFAGFHYATSTDAAGNQIATHFHTASSTDSGLGEYEDDISKIFKPYRVETYDNNNNLFSTTINTWDRYNEGNDRDFVKLIQTLNFSYDGNSSHRDSAVSFSYDDVTRLLTQRVEWGEVAGTQNGTFTDVGADKRFTNFTYASSSPIIGIVAEEITKNTASTTVKDIKRYYDGLTLWSATKGNETKREMWESGSTYIDIEKIYNSLGLVTEEKDPRDKATTFVYDSKSLYPATTTNPVGHIGLDRVTTEKIPDSDSPSSLVTKKTIAYTDTVGARKTLETNYLNSATSTESYTYLDGFDRKIQTRQEAEDANTYSAQPLRHTTTGLLRRPTHSETAKASSMMPSEIWWR